MTKKTTRRAGANTPALPSRRQFLGGDHADICIDQKDLIIAAKVIYRVVSERMRRQKPMEMTDTRTGLPLSRAEIRRSFSRVLMRARCGLYPANGGAAA